MIKKILTVTVLAFFSLNLLSQNKTILQHIDTNKVDINDGYIVLMGRSNCDIIDYFGNTLFSCPGNYVSLYHKKNAVVAHCERNLVEYDKNLDINWKISQYIHHELTVTAEDNILLLSNEEKDVNNEKIIFDDVVCFNSKGKLLHNWSTYEQRWYLLNYIMRDTNIFLYKNNGESDPERVFSRIIPSLNFQDLGTKSKREFFHMNAIHEIPYNNLSKTDDRFRKGNIMLNFCSYNDSIASFIAIVDPIDYKILWHYVQKDKKTMHTPSMLPNGHILVYVNAENDQDSTFIDEINPITKEVVWSYTEKFPNPNMRKGIGSCQRLTNGNTLVSNNNGYIYEITPGKEIAWQLFINEPVKPVYRAFKYPKERIKWIIDEK